MPEVLDPQTRKALADRLRYYNDLGIYDFYRRAYQQTSSVEQNIPEVMEPAPQMPRAIASSTATDRPTALRLIREEIGDCTRCRLHKQGRKQIVFGVGNPNAELMFIGEAPGADEDIQGEPFVGRAGQLLTNMIKAMGLGREDV